MKPNKKICERCGGLVKAGSAPDVILPNGISVSGTYVLHCMKIEVPKECPYIAEHAVSQKEKSF